jgi:NAD(P)-dependent dehydrogenase (short-subunit alcohol dehydrogenase family)
MVTAPNGSGRGEATGIPEFATPDLLHRRRAVRHSIASSRRQGDGLVVNVGSILGRVTFPFFGLYGASKYALEALTDSYRYELSQLGVDVVLVQPSASLVGRRSPPLTAKNQSVN